MRHKRNGKPSITNALPGNSYNFFTGLAESGKNVSEKNSMELTAVNACVRVISEAMASLPLGLYTDQGNTTVKATQHSLYRIVHDEPNPEMTSFSFRETMMTHLLLWGNAYAQIIRNGKGEVQALYILMPEYMKVDRDSSGKIYYEYQKQQGDAPTLKTSVIRFKPEQILHIPGLGFDGLVGYSPIAMAKNTIGMALACEEYGSKFFKNGANPSGILSHPGTLSNPENVRNAWNAAFSGSGNAGKVAVLDEGMKYQPISFSPEQNQLSQTRAYQLDEIARIFRVPPHMIGDLGRATYANIEQQSLEFVKYTLDPWVCRWEQALARRLLRDEEKGKYFFKFNVDGLLRGDYNSRMNGYAIGRQNGWLSSNDIRRLEDMDLIPAEQGGDEYLVNGNMAKLKDAGAAYEQQVKEGTEE